MFSATEESDSAELPVRRRVALTKLDDGRMRSGLSTRIRAVPSARSDFVAHATPGPPELGMRIFESVGLDDMEARSKKPR